MPKQIFQNHTVVWHILFTLFIPAILQAQDIAVHTQHEAEILNDLLRDNNRLDLNQASAHELRLLPTLTPALINGIIDHRPFGNIQDLIRVPRLTRKHIALITPYVSVTPPRPWHSTFTLRVSRPANHATQFDNLRLYQRLQITAPNKISGFFLTERDPNEPDIADLVTGYLEIPIQNTKLILGDIRPQFGQGLIFSRRTRTSIGLSLARSQTTTRAGNRTSTEQGALRGVHLTHTNRYLTFTALFGFSTWDAAL